MSKASNNNYNSYGIPERYAVRHIVCNCQFVFAFYNKTTHSVNIEVQILAELKIYI